MSLQIETVVSSIAELQVQDLQILRVDNVPATSSGREKYLIPLPNFITDFEAVRDSFGGGSTALQTVMYTLNYRLLYAPAGAGRGDVLEWVSGLTLMVGYIFDAILAVDVLEGAVDITPAGITNMGLVNAPDDRSFYGCDIAVRVTEFVN